MGLDRGWIYRGKPFGSADIGDSMGFVYLVTDIGNGKKYIGKKGFWITRRLPPLKGKKRKRTVRKESDWQDYFGSSGQVKLLLEEYGPARFRREILRLCKSKGEMNYFEAREQFVRDVLLDDGYYNDFIGVKVHRRHLG